MRVALVLCTMLRILPILGSASFHRTQGLMDWNAGASRTTTGLFASLNGEPTRGIARPACIYALERLHAVQEADREGQVP